jgi:hypothetical protein
MKSRGGEEARSVEEALQQALAHTRAAACEGLLAARCLLDAASLALYGEPAARTGDGAGEARLALAAMARGLDELATLARGQTAASVPDGVMQALLGALDAEIGRWEQRSREDRDARGVLRAFLGLREILWEFGVRAADDPPAATPMADSDAGEVHWQGSEERIAAALRRAC